MAITPLNLKMKRLLALLALAPLLASPLSARADLGAAEKIKGEFDAWCAKGGNKCKVTFSEDNLTVDGSSSITKNELQKVSYDNRFYCTPASGFSSSKCYGKGSALVYYIQNGKEGAGAFIFADDNAYFDFVTALEVFCGAKCRPLGPSVKVTP